MGPSPSGAPRGRPASADAVATGLAGCYLQQPGPAVTTTLSAEGVAGREAQNRCAGGGHEDEGERRDDEATDGRHDRSFWRSGVTTELTHADSRL